MLNKEEYLGEVCAQIKFRAARKYLKQELAAHIDDKKEEYLKSAAAEAEAQAVASMGDAIETGRALNAVHRPRTEWGVIACVLALTIAGFLTIWLGRTGDIYLLSGWQLEEQIRAVIFGICLLVAAYFFNYTYLVRLRYVLYAAAVILVVYYAVMARYEDMLYEQGSVLAVFSFTSLQSPVIALSTLLFMMGIFGFIDKCKDKGILWLLPAVGLCVISIAAMTFIGASFYALLLSVVYLAALGTAVFIMERKNLLRAFYLLVPAIIFAVTLILMTSLRSHLLYSNYVIGFGTSLGTDYNADEVPRLLAGSKIIGASPYYLEWQSAGLSGSSTDFILTYVIASCGWLAGIGFILVYGALLAFLFVRSIRIAHTSGRIIAIGISAFLLTRFAACVLTNVGIISDVSCGLPFVSYGRFDYIANSLLVGLFLSVWRRSTFMKDKVPVRPVTQHADDIKEITTT